LSHSIELTHRFGFEFDLHQIGQTHAADLQRSGIFILARVDAEQTVRWAPTNQAGGQRHQAQPAPNAYGTRGRQCDQDKTAHDADDAFDVANVLGHVKLQSGLKIQTLTR
jgi:hypothetical protein